MARLVAPSGRRVASIAVIVCLLVWLLFELVLVRLVSAAESPRVFGILQYDLDSDGRPDLTVIDSMFVTERDFVYVYDGGSDMRVATTWQEAVDFQNDTWLFDIGADGSIDLVIVFRQENGRDIAYIHDDQNRDGRVNVRRNGRHVVIDESPFWTAKVESGSTWYLPDGSLDHNIRVLVDGPLSPFGFPESYLRELRASGEPKWEVGIVDGDNDGIPEYSYSLLLAPSPPTSQLARSGLAVNSGRKRPAPPQGYVFWPLLGGASWYGNANYFDSPFHLDYDWKQRKLVRAQTSGYPIEHGYHINTLQYVTRERVNYVDFENPMAYYDMAGDRDGRPELFVRMSYFGTPTPLQEVTYSWNQYNTPNLHWHFKLGLVGRHEAVSQVQIGDFIVKTVPHVEFPRGVVSQEWEIATFVADEGGAYNSSEGIYEWAPLEGVIPDASTMRAALPGAEHAVADFIQGRSPASPSPYFNNIRSAFRAEYSETPGPASLYFSPIDHRLHLLKAQKGVWNLGSGRELRYATTGGNYLNIWQLREAGQDVKTLWRISDQLVVADEAGVHLRREDVPPALFTTTPPTSPDEWQQLERLLDVPHRNDTTLASNPSAMFNQFSGPVLALPGASIRDLRVTSEGFRFILTLPSGEVPGVPFTRGRTPGEYIAFYEPPKGYQLDLAPPPSLNVALTIKRQAPGASPTVGNPAATYMVRQPLNLAVRVTNGSAVDASGVHLEVIASATGSSGQAAERVVGTATFDSLAGEASDVFVAWAPPAAGEWTIYARVRAHSAAAELSERLTVQPAVPVSPRALLAPHLSVVAILVLLIGGISVTAALLVLSALQGPVGRGTRREQLEH